MISIKPPKIIFFDIDETLYLRSIQGVPKSVFTAFKKLKAQGVILAIATGRSVGIFPDAIKRLIEEIGVDILVTINGQYVSHHDKCLVHFPLTVEQIDGATDVLIQQGVAYAYMTADTIWAMASSRAMEQALATLQIAYQLTTLADFDKKHRIYQILAFYDDNRQANLNLPNLKTTRWHISGVDILDSRGSKARGIAAVLDKLGIGFDEAWAFGDGLNDMEMLKAVGFGVAMGNAHPQLQAIADFVCPKACDDGIYQGLRVLGVI